MDWKKVLSYDGSAESKIGIALDVILIVVFIFWGLHITNNVFGDGLEDGLKEIKCIMTNPQYHNMVWNNSGLFPVGYNTSIFQGMSGLDIQKFLEEYNKTG